MVIANPVACAVDFCLAADPFSAPEQEIGGGTDTIVAKAATVTVAIIGVGGSAVAGTAYALYKEVNFPAILDLWVITVYLSLSHWEKVCIMSCEVVCTTITA